MKNIQSSLNYIVLIIAVMGIALVSFIIFFLSGLFIGEMINPASMNYECACDSHPVLTELQAVIIGAVEMIGLSIALYRILCSIKTVKMQACIAWFMVSFLLNGASCFIALDILCTQVSG